MTAEEQGTAGRTPDATEQLAPEPLSPEQRRLAQETKDERHMWVFLAYFLFGIHIVAFVMIYAVRHAK
ncbi:nitrate reductase NapE component [Streptomyces sp. 3330]|uniref:hypothetical protein n=1 Tax=Streptomyces sp. 3330 TaxID=2817755 RepID=UPI0028665D34|nr:hypothetical protein [Streptomyces sp. 3330]MDR6980892.1 nitrate reductase NapE component [Streptomyces sp. 3330]